MRWLHDRGRDVDRAADEVGLTDEARDPRRVRVPVDRVGGADLHDPAVAEHGDLVAEDECLVLVVRHEDRGDADVADDLGDFGAELDAKRGIERGERFVEQEHRRLWCKRACQGNPLLLSTGQRVREPIGERGQVDQREHLPDAGDPLGARQLAVGGAQAERDVLRHGQVREQRTVLEHHADAAPLGVYPRAPAARSRLR